MKLCFLHKRKPEEEELFESPSEVKLFAAALFSNTGEKIGPQCVLVGL